MTYARTRANQVTDEQCGRIEYFLLTARMKLERLRQCFYRRDRLVLLEHSWQFRPERVRHWHHVAHSGAILAGRQRRPQGEGRKRGLLLAHEVWSLFG